MRWQDDLVAIATKASHVAVGRRRAAAIRKYKALLTKLHGQRVSTQILKDTLGMKRPHSAVRTMVKLGMLVKVRPIPQHWEYDVVPPETLENLK